MLRFARNDRLKIHERLRIRELAYFVCLYFVCLYFVCLAKCMILFLDEGAEGESQV